MSEPIDIEMVICGEARNETEGCLMKEITRLRELVEELTKCECIINTNWHEGVPYDYRSTCEHCDNRKAQLAAANAVCEKANKFFTKDSTVTYDDMLDVLHTWLDARDEEDFSRKL